MTLQAFALLGALATLSCLTGGRRVPQLAFVFAGMLAGFALLQPSVLALPFAPLLAVAPSQVALLLVLLALGRLRGNLNSTVALIIGGLLAVVWMQALGSVGWPLFAALPFVLCVVAATFLLGLKRNFCPPSLQDEVSLFVLVGGLLVALVPDMLGGWQSAQVMQGAAEATVARSNKVVWIAAGFVVLGAVFAWWKSNRRWSR